MYKVVLNKCYGGFGLSPKAEKLYWERKLGKKIFAYKEDYENKVFIKTENLDHVRSFSISFVTQDYGVAAMILGKSAYGIHQSGKWYTNENIDQMLMERHLAKKARNAKKKHHLKGPAKRTEEDDQRFEVSLEKLISVVDRNPLLRQN